MKYRKNAHSFDEVFFIVNFRSYALVFDFLFAVFFFIIFIFFNYLYVYVYECRTHSFRRAGSNQKLHFSSLNVFVPHVSTVFSIPIDWFTILFFCPFSRYTIWFDFMWVCVCMCMYVSELFSKMVCKLSAVVFPSLSHTHSHKLNSYIFQNAENGIRKFSNCRAKKKRKRRTNYKIDSPYFLPNVWKLVKSVSSTYSKVYSPNAQITSSSFLFFPHLCPLHFASLSLSLPYVSEWRTRETVIRGMTQSGTGRDSDAVWSWKNVEIGKERTRESETKKVWNNNKVFNLYKLSTEQWTFRLTQSHYCPPDHTLCIFHSSLLLICLFHSS